MEVPISMRGELAKVKGIGDVDLEIWVGCAGNFSLAVGYAALLWPEFELVNNHLVRAGTTEDAVQEFGRSAGATRRSVEATVNHLHLWDLHYVGCKDCTADKLLALGKVLKEMHEARLQWQFPDRPCTVTLSIPEDAQDLGGYQLTFWQNDLSVTE